MAAISWYQMTGDMVKFTEIFRVLIVAGNTPVVTYNDTNMSLNKKKKNIILATLVRRRRQPFDNCRGQHWFCPIRRRANQSPTSSRRHLEASWMTYGGQRPPDVGMLVRLLPDRSMIQNSVPIVVAKPETYCVSSIDEL